MKSDLQNKEVGDRPALSWKKRFVFSLLPVLVLVLLAEIGLRAFDLDQSLISLQEDDDERADVDLFWSMAPNAEFVLGNGTEVRTNSLGLRGPEVPPKGPNEIRVLSLGESTTFGSGVPIEQSYSSLLETHLNEQAGSHTYRVVNAGVSAYSSFQSLKYLQLRGLLLQPDVVLFYHEINDYWATSEVRLFSESRTDRHLTDRELYHSTEHRFHRTLLSLSAIYRSLTYEILKRKHLEDPARPLYVAKKLPGIDPNIDPDSPELPRVPPADRLLILGELKRICADNDITLVVIHPSYRDDTKPHECELTWFCETTNTLIFDAHDSLHPDAGTGLFVDAMHPTAAGHARMAGDLYAFLRDHALARNDRRP